MVNLLKSFFIASCNPSKINCTERAASKIPIILDNTCNSFFDINFSYFIINKNNKQVINRTENKDIICEKDPIKLPKVVLDDTITEVIAAGPS